VQGISVTPEHHLSTRARVSLVAQAAASSQSSNCRRAEQMKEDEQGRRTGSLPGRLLQGLVVPIGLARLLSTTDANASSDAEIGTNATHSQVQQRHANTHHATAWALHNSNAHRSRKANRVLTCLIVLFDPASCPSVATSSGSAAACSAGGGCWGGLFFHGRQRQRFLCNAVSAE
jgi:hypothetical protein